MILAHFIMGICFYDEKIEGRTLKEIIKMSSFNQDGIGETEDGWNIRRMLHADRYGV